MTSQFFIQLTCLSMLAVFVVGVAFKIGRKFGQADRLPQLEMLWRYQHAVDDLDRWCGHTSPHAKLIARHLTAHGEGLGYNGEGLGYNGGTPNTDEACGISGLRTQLKTLDVIESTLGEHAVGGDRLRAAMRAYSAGQQMKDESRAAVTAIVMNPDTYRDAPSIHPISRA